MIITKETKNSLALSNEAKQTNSLWNERYLTWGDTGPAGDTWAYPGTALTLQAKISLSLTNESKHAQAPTFDETNPLTFDDTDPNTFDSLRS